MNKSEVERLEEQVANLESAAGLNPDIEVLHQLDDGTYPEPQTTAQTVILVRHVWADEASEVRDQQRHNERDLQWIQVQAKRVSESDIWPQLRQDI
jgi:hypothetical protein